jgi:hypothetical protein
MEEYQVVNNEPLKACDIMCTVDGINRRKDFTATIRLATERECGRELYHDLVDLQGATARVIIAPDNTDPQAAMSTDVGANKHPSGSLSKRLRSVLYRRWESSEHSKHFPFDKYYKMQMESIIESQKELI